MFTPRAGGSRSSLGAYSAARGTRSTPQTRRSTGLFATPRQSPYNTRTKTPGNRSLSTSTIVEETAQHSVEGYGVSLPVLISEVLTLAERPADISVTIEPSGWAWLVYGRRLFVWKYKPNKFGKAPQCKELTLPPSELSHSAELVAVISSGDQTACCVGVSPEGIVRYWPNVAHEGSYVEISADLKGEVAASVISLKPYGCVLSTTTSSLTLLQLSNTTITSQPMRGSEGMLSGFGRRMSSFIFGSISAQAMGAPMKKLLPGERLTSTSCAFYVLTETHLQKWLVSDSDPGRLLYQCEVGKIFRECLGQTKWGQDAAHLPHLKTWLIDIQLSKDGVVILGAGCNLDISPRMVYVVATLNTEGTEAPLSFLSFTISTFTERYREDEEDDLLDYELLLPDSRSATAFMYNDRLVLFLSVTSSTQPIDKVEFQGSGDALLGAGCCDGLPLFFSRIHGLVSIKVSRAETNTSFMDDSLADVSSRPESAMGPSDQAVLELSMSGDKQTRLKAAFLQSCRGNQSEAQRIVDELFPPGPPTVEPGSTLDTMVTVLSQELIDDYPASDPRWAEAMPQDAASSSSSLILLHQLEDKKKAHEYLLAFLKNVALWERLGTVIVRDYPMSTRMLLCEHAEKLVAATTLRKHHTQNSHMVDLVIRKVLESRDSPQIAPGLTPHDLFYREVSKIHEIIEGLIEYEEEIISADTPPNEMVTVVTSVNGIVEGMLHDAWQFRENKAAMFPAVATTIPEPEFIPWTTSLGSRGLRMLVTKQHTFTIEQAIPEAQDTQVRGLLFQQLLDLTDIILDGYRTQMDSARARVGEADEHYAEQRKAFEQARTNLINPFLHYEQYDRSASLAEKYNDFGILVKICDLTKNQERLQRYVTVHGNKGFSEFVFKWYMEEGKRGKLLSQPLIHNAELGRFLQTEDNKFLSWLHDINTGQFMQAHRNLKNLARIETGSLNKKKTLLSLSKLSALASDDPYGVIQDVQDALDDVNEEETLILHQETLPPDVLEGIGMDPDAMNVLTPKQLIELYVSDYNANANEFDFKKALDLLQYIDKDAPDMDVEVLKLHIWCRCILKDSWDDLATDEPLESIRETVFFRTVELIYTEDSDLNQFLPDLENLLLSDELGNLRDNSSFHFLVRAGYEHLQKMVA